MDDSQNPYSICFSDLITTKAGLTGERRRGRYSLEKISVFCREHAKSTLVTNSSQWETLKSIFNTVKRNKHRVCGVVSTMAMKTTTASGRFIFNTMAQWRIFK
jgi:hypothetical protein